MTIDQLKAEIEARLLPEDTDMGYVDDLDRGYDYALRHVLDYIKSQEEIEDACSD